MSSTSPARGQSRSATKSRRRFTVDALFTDNRPQAVGVEDLLSAKEIRLDRIEADPDQPRRSFDPERLAELTASVRREGILQPIAVRYDQARDVYVVIHGERRLRAAREAGLATIPAIVRDVPQDRLLVQQLMENVVREDLNAIDRAAALRALKAQLDDPPWEAVAEMVGIRRSRLFQLLGTEKLPEQAQNDIRAGRISEKQSRALQGLEPLAQDMLRNAILEFDLPAEEALRIARLLKDAKVSDDRDRIAEIIDEARQARGRRTASGSEDPLSVAASLFASIEAAAAREPGAAEALAASARSARAPAFDGDRLRREVLALARTLSRTPAEELIPGGSAHMPLSMLRAVLNTLLSDS